MGKIIAAFGGLASVGKNTFVGTEENLTVGMINGNAVNRIGGQGTIVLLK